MCVLVSQEKKCSFSLKFKLLKVYSFEKSLRLHDRQYIIMYYIYVFFQIAIVSLYD